MVETNKSPDISSPAPPPAPQEKPKKSLIIALITLLLVLTGVAGFLAYQNYQLRQQISDLNQQKEETTTTETKAFSQLLQENCYEKKERQFVIGLEKLPFSINEDFANINVDYLTSEEGKKLISCHAVEPEGKPYLLLRYKYKNEEDDYFLNIYDENSSEDFLMSALDDKRFQDYEEENIFDEQDDIQIAFFLYYPEGPFTPKDIGIWLVGKRKIKLAAGNEIFVSSRIKFIEKGDLRLVELFSKYSNNDPDKVVVYQELSELENDVRERFFSTASEVEKKDTDRISALQLILKTIN